MCGVICIWWPWTMDWLSQWLTFKLLANYMRPPYLIGKLKYNWMVLRVKQMSRGWPLSSFFHIGNEHIGPTTAPVGFDRAAWGRLISAPRRNRWIWYFLRVGLAQWPSRREVDGKKKNQCLRCVILTLEKLFSTAWCPTWLFCKVICWFN